MMEQLVSTFYVGKQKNARVIKIKNKRFKFVQLVIKSRNTAK